MDYRKFIVDESVPESTQKTYNSINNIYFKPYLDENGINNYPIETMIEMIAGLTLAEKTKRSIFLLLMRLYKHSGASPEQITSAKRLYHNSSDEENEPTETKMINDYILRAFRKHELKRYVVNALIYNYGLCENELRNLPLTHNKVEPSTDGIYFKKKSIVVISKQHDKYAEVGIRKCIIHTERLLDYMTEMYQEKGCMRVLDDDDILTEYTYMNKTDVELNRLFCDHVGDIAKIAQRKFYVNT